MVLKDAGEEMGKRRFVMYIPFFVFRGVHHKKDPGCIPAEFSKLGFESFLIVGDSESNTDSILFKMSLTKNADHLSLSSNFKEMFAALKELNRLKPSIFMCYNTSLMNPILSAYFRARRLFFRNSSDTRLILKMDSDGTFDHGSLFNCLFKITTFLNSIFFDRIIIESSCGLRNITPFVMRSEKIKVIPNGYPSESYRMVGHDIPRQKIVLCVGRITPEKGLIPLISTFERAVKIFTDWSLLIVGPIQNDKFYKELLSMIRYKSLDDRVKITGEVSERTLEEIYKMSSIFCSLSRHEGFQVARIEAIVNGLPLIVTSAGCGQDIKGAMVVAIDDVEGSYRNMVLLMGDHQLRIRIVEDEQKNVYTWHEIVTRILQDVN